MAEKNTKFKFRTKKPAKKKIDKESLIKKLPPNPTFLDYLVYSLKVIGATILSLMGTFSWLFKSLIVVSCALIVSVIIVGTVTYVKVKPELDSCRELAYDKLAQMKRTDFSMLSDTEVYDKDNNLIGTYS